MPGKLEAKVALVTGGGSGLGKAAAILMAKEGAKVGVISRSMDELQQTVNEIQRQGGEAVAMKADISVPEDMQEASRKLAERFGHLDIVFANAGINGVWAPLEELTLEDWDKTLDINLKGTFLTVKYAVPYLKK